MQIIITVDKTMEIRVRISDGLLQGIYVDRNRLFLPQYYVLGMINMVHSNPDVALDRTFFISSYF